MTVHSSGQMKLLVLCGLFLLKLVSAFDSLQTQVDLGPHYNNKAAAKDGHRADFNGAHGSYPAEYLPVGTLIDQNIQVGGFIRI